VGAAPPPVMVAVKVTTWPLFAGVTDVASAIAEASRTESVDGAEVLVPYEELPLYCATTAWSPTPTPESEHETVGPDTGRSEHATPPSTSMLCVPVKVPAVPLEIVAVAVTDCPPSAGLGDTETVVVVAARTVTAVEPEPALYALLPPYDAVTVVGPGVRPVFVHAAVPPESATLLQSVVLPLENVTEPVAVPLVPVTEAVNVTFLSWSTGFADAESATVGLTFTGAVTTCESAAEELVAYAVAPLYCATIECVAAESDEIAQVAWPEAFTATPLQIAAASDMKFTVPVDGVPAGLVTVAVKVTDCPDVDGFTDELTTVVVGYGVFEAKSPETPARVLLSVSAAFASSTLPTAEPQAAPVAFGSPLHVRSEGLENTMFFVVDPWKYAMMSEKSLPHGEEHSGSPPVQPPEKALHESARRPPAHE